MKYLSTSRIIIKGIENLVSLQERDGSFLHLLSTQEQDFTNATGYHTVFLNTIIFSSILSLPSEKNLDVLKKKLATFLLSQKSNYWTWNYLLKNSQESRESSYPDDLDDTFCALSALTLYNKNIISGDVFANVVKILTSVEEKEGGPYRTWLVKKTAAKQWQDVDVAVNANIAYFLSLHNITLPNLEKYFDTLLKRKNISSPYYPSFYAPCYFLSRFYQGKNKSIIEELFWKTRNKDGSWENSLKTAMAVVTLLHLGVLPKKLEKSIAYLVSTQKNGLWPAYGFCINTNKNNKAYFAGATSLTTALCIEALQKYLSVQQEKLGYKQQMLKEEKEKQHIYNASIKQVTLYLNSSGKEINGKAESLLQRVLKNDSAKQIPLIPYYFYQSLKKKNKNISKNILTQLSVANVLGWIAYTIYDDFLDEEGDPLLLPTAAVALRQLTLIYDTFPLMKKRVQKLFHSILNTIDNANAWEVKYCRIKYGAKENTNFEQLANKSIGHGLGPLTVLLLSGYTEKSKEFKLLLAFFKHYLITKQLNDDAHDWEQDLRKGHLTPVVSLLLKKAEEKHIVKKTKNLKEFFWQEIIQEVCLLIYFHAKKAKLALHKLLPILDPIMLELLLEKNVRAADLALEQQKKMTEFLQTYSS